MPLKPIHLKRSLTNLISVLAYSNIWVSLAMAAISISLFLTNRQEIDLPGVIHKACLTFLSYNYIYWLGYVNDPSNMEPDRRQLMDQIKISSAIMSMAAIIYGLYGFWHYTPAQWIMLIPLCFLTLFYSLPTSNNTGLRWIPGLKSITIALSWTLLALPVKQFSLLPLNTILIEAIMIFLFVLALIIPFDIRDSNNDSASLKTIPQLIGLKTSLALSQFLILSVGVCLILIGNHPGIRIMHAMAALFSMALISKSINRDSLYYVFVLEGIPVYWVFAWWLLR